MVTMTTELKKAEPFISGKPESVLAGVWRTILKDQRIDNALVIERITAYCESLEQVSVKRRAQIRGNMRTDAFKDGLTLYTFSKLLRALSVDEVQFDFHCKHLRRTSAHRLTLPITDDFVDKKEREEDVKSPLGPFLAKMMFDLGVDYSMFEALLEFYMRRTMKTCTPKTRNDLRAYFRKEFRSDKMSWNSLINGFNFLCVVMVNMTITLKYKYDFRTTHTYKFTLSELAFESDNKDIEDGI